MEAAAVPSASAGQYAGDRRVLRGLGADKSPPPPGGPWFYEMTAAGVGA